uniref:PRTRC system protein B n=1 Tax=viral metagenome TaxID=1070528 RepID=A0A6M3IL84_9ZZZZ
MTTKTETNDALQWAVPESLAIPPDPLRARIDFHNQACTLTLFDGDVCKTKIVSAMEVAHALAQELAISSGLLPEGALWWRNTKLGPMTAFYEKPKLWRLALQEKALTAPRRFFIPLPGFIFLCMPGRAPWVYAIKSRPRALTDKVFHAPLYNVHENGSTCAGNHKYPQRVDLIIDSFFRSFFNREDEHAGRRSKKNQVLAKLWESLEGQKKYPLDDLIEFGTVRDLVEMEMP